MYTLDTNAIIYYLNGEEQVVTRLEEIFLNNVTTYISSVTETELFSFPELSTHEAISIEQLLATLAIISIDSQVARIAAELRRTKNVKTIDALIAATALYTGTTLLTRNIKDFRTISQLKIEQI